MTDKTTSELNLLTHIINKKDYTNTTNPQGLFVTDENELINISWDLLLRKETATEKYKRIQKEILKEVFEE